MRWADLILIISLRGTADAPVDPPCRMMDSFIQEMSEDAGVCVCLSLCVCGCVSSCAIFVLCFVDKTSLMSCVTSTVMVL